MPASPSLTDKAATFDTLGTQIWNAATNLIREDEDESDPRMKRKGITALATTLRVFAFLLIDTAHQSLSKHSKDGERQLRVLKTGLKTARFCLNKNSLELALKVLERCSDYVTAAEEAEPILHLAQDLNSTSADLQTSIKHLVTEYYLLRTTYAWRSSRFDVAAYFGAKISNEDPTLCADLAEKAADLFHEAGKSFTSQNMTEQAIAWCERAIKALDAHNLEELSPHAVDLRFSVTATLIDTLLCCDDTASFERSASLLRRLEEEFGLGNRMAVSLMRFKLLTFKPPVDAEQLEGVLRHMIRLVVLTDQNFRM